MTNKNTKKLEILPDGIVSTLNRFICMQWFITEFKLNKSITVPYVA